jgi:hypothetical protein
MPRQSRTDTETIEGWAASHPEAKIGTIKVDPHFDGDVLVSKLGNVAVPTHFTCTMDVDAWPAVVEVEIRIEDGKPRCVRWQLRQREGDPPLMAAAVRGVPFALALQRAVQAAAFEPDDQAGLFSLLLPGARASAQREAIRQVKRRGRPATSPAKVTEVLKLWDAMTGQHKRADAVAAKAGISRTKVYEIVRSRKGDTT